MKKKIKILRAVHVVELSWASIVLIFSFNILHLGCRAWPWTSHGSIENQKFQIAQIKILTADLKSAWKTVCWKCFSFFKIPSGSLSKSTLKIFKEGKFNDFTKKLKGKVCFAIFDSTFDHLLIGISKKGKHFQLSVFSADSKSAVRIGIWVIWNFGFPIGVGLIEGKARPPKSRISKPILISIEAWDSPTTWYARRMFILLFLSFRYKLVCMHVRLYACVSMHDCE